MPAPTPRARSPGRALRTVAVADDLDQLRGPLSGPSPASHHLDASARHRYDFADEQWRELAYWTVLMEVGSDADLTEWLDKIALLELWAAAVPAALRAPGPGAPPSCVGPRRRPPRTSRSERRAALCRSGHVQAEVAEVALRAIDQHGFALAGAGVPVAHVVISRPPQDPDLFTPH